MLSEAVFAYLRDTMSTVEDSLLNETLQRGTGHAALRQDAGSNLLLHPRAMTALLMSRNVAQ